MVSLNLKPIPDSLTVEGRKWLGKIHISEYTCLTNQNAKNCKQIWKGKLVKRKSRWMIGLALSNMAVGSNMAVVSNVDVGSNMAVGSNMTVVSNVDVGSNLAVSSNMAVGKKPTLAP